MYSISAKGFMKIERKNKRLGMVMTAFERQQLEEISIELGMTMSQLIRLATRQFIATQRATK